MLPGTQINTANGVAVRATANGSTSAAGIRAASIRCGAAATIPTPPRCSVDIMVDNLTWSALGRLLRRGPMARACRISLRATQPEPATRHPPRVIAWTRNTRSGRAHRLRPVTFGAATTALQVGRGIWVGTARDQGLARFRFPNSAEELASLQGCRVSKKVVCAVLPRPVIDATEGLQSSDRSRCDSHPCGLPTARTRHHRHDRLDSARHRRRALDPRAGWSPGRRPKGLVLTLTWTL